MIDKKKRGGQPGNWNALKHGFYSRQFQAGETVDLENTEEWGLTSEINMLRVMTRRLFELAGAHSTSSGQGCGDVQELAGTLGALGTASIRLASLMKTQKLLGSDSKEDEVAAAISQAIDEVMKEWNIHL
jgi:hypothetical protein